MKLDVARKRHNGVWYYNVQFADKSITKLRDLEVQLTIYSNGEVNIDITNWFQDMVVNLQPSEVPRLIKALEMIEEELERIGGAA